MNLIIFRGKGYQETWYLLIPKDIPLSPKEIVDLYARRMSIEQGFRDWKTHLGVRGLVFYCDDPAPRLTRLLLGFSLAYLLCLALGASGEANRSEHLWKSLDANPAMAPDEPFPPFPLASCDFPCLGLQT